MPVPKRHFNHAQQRALMQAFEQLVALLSSGLPLRSALQVVQSQCRSPLLQHTFGTLASAVNDGLTLHQAAFKLPRQFNLSMLGYLELADQSGEFNDVLTQMVIEFNLNDQQRRDVLAAIRYPLAILAMTLLISTSLLVWVLPKFTALFAYHELPELTQLLLRFSEVIQQHGLLLFGGFTLTILSMLLLRRYCRLQWQQLLLGLPWLGGLFQQSRKQQLFQRLALLLAAGMTAVAALKLTAHTSPWLRTRNECLAYADLIANGNSWSSSLSTISADDSLISTYLSTGEQTGHIDQMMKRLAEQLQQRLQHRVKRVIGLIQPLLMLMLGGIIGALLLAMYLPIFNLGQQF